jgi:hypothetical protein
VHAGCGQEQRREGAGQKSWHRLILLVGLACLFAAPTGSGATAVPSLTLNVNLSGALEVVLANGTRISSTGAPGAAIPPGPYLVVVASDVPDSRDLFHIFHLYGPSLNVESDLLPCENPRPLYTVTLKPSTTYFYEDTRNPQLGQVVFTTAATGSSSSTAGAAAAVGSNGTSAGTSSNTSVLATALPFRGALVGTVDADGALTLSRNGKNVSSLAAGRYSISVDDRTPRLGFQLSPSSGRKLTVTSPSFVGEHRMTVTLTPGHWTFGRHRFTVSSAS